MRFAKILHYLANLDPNSLLIIDNIEDLEDAELPKLRALPCKVIASSRLTLKGFEVYPLGFLSTEKCRTLFMQNYRGKPDDTALEKIIELTGRHTLSVELLAKTAKNGDLEIVDLLKQLQTRGFDLAKTIPESVETTWHNETQKKQFFKHMESVFELANISKDEQFILANLSVLPAIFIGRKELTDWLKLQTKDDLNSLVEKGWLQQQNSQVFVHQIIQEVVRHKFKPTAKTCEGLINSLSWKLKVEPGQNPLAKAGHAIFAESVLANLSETEQELANLANNLAVVYRALGQFQKAMEFNKKSLKINKEILEPNHPELATSYNNLAIAYLVLGHFEKALEFKMKSVNIEQEIFAPNHPLLANSYTNIGEIYRALGQFQKALEFQLKSLKIGEEVLAPNHPDLAISYNNLALVYMALNQFQKALEFQMKSLKINEETLDPNHPGLAISYNNIGEIYNALGQLEKALEFQMKSLKIKEEILDTNHPDLADSYNNLAIIYYQQKDYRQAHDYSKKSVEIYQIKFPDGHPNFGTVLNTLVEIKKHL